MKSSPKKYLTLSFITFMFFMLELFSLGVVEPFFFGVMYNSYHNFQKGLHSILTIALWLVSIFFMILYSNQLDIKIDYLKYRKLHPKNWLITVLLLFICKIITYIDWGTLKVIGEFHKKNSIYLFTTQYLYYFAEIALMLLVVVYAQKAFDLWRNKQSSIPFGGLFLALTWGAFHFISTGGDLWNGLSCIFFSMICGFAYLSLNKNIPLFYLFMSIGYLL